jgi:hypothetical protein
MAISEDSATISQPPAENPAAPVSAGAINPAALTVEQAARILTAVGGRWTTEETIRRHLEEGAPTTADGRINLVHYMAWLIRELSVDEE